MGIPHDELLHRVTARELAKWEAFERVEGPLGGRRDDVLAAMTAHYVIAALGGKSRLKRLIPQWDQTPQQQDWRAMRARWRAATGGG